MFTRIETIPYPTESSTLNRARNVSVVLYNIRVQTAVQGNAISGRSKPDGLERRKNNGKGFLNILKEFSVQLARKLYG